MKTKQFITALLAGALSLGASAREAKDITVYINPGHGGHESNDRNVVIPPYELGDPNGYWESNSNLSKGLQLRDMLEAKGYKVVMSRVTNTEADDLPLSTIVRLANNSKADIYFSIHSNATGTSARRNRPLMLFRGLDNEPENPEAYKICEILNRQLLENQVTYWTNKDINIRGDWSFYNWGIGVGLGALRGLTVPGMLSEGSFHDYIPETYRLMSDEYCYLEAWHFRKTVDEYFGIPGVSTGLVCGRISDSRVPGPEDFISYGTDKLATIQKALVELKDAEGKTIDSYTTHAMHINGVYLFKDVAPGHYTVSVTCDTHMPMTQEVDVTADQATYCNFQMSKVRDSAPSVEWVTPLWKEGEQAVLCNTPVTVQFNWDMDIESTEKAFRIEPAIEGKFAWEDLNHRMIFTPSKAYDTNTLYTVTIDKSAMHGGLVPMEQPYSFSFKTSDRNFMDILGYFPSSDEKVHYKNVFIEFRFDKQPSLGKLLSQISCTDSKGNKVAFNNRGKTNSKKDDPYGWFRIPVSKPLTVGETYTVTLSGDFADKDGLTIQETVNATFTATDESSHKGTSPVIDDMNDATLYTAASEGSTSIKQSSVAAHKDPLFDAATQFTYTFDGLEGGEALFERTTQVETLITSGQTLGLHVFGDLSDNELYLEFSTEMSVQYVKVCNLDFLGWRYIDVPATIEAPGHISGVKLVQKASQRSGSGTFALDDILMAGDSGVDGVTLESVTVHPNPASEYLVANAGNTILSLKLYDMNGCLASSVTGNVMNVSELPDGNYIAVVSTAAATSSHRIIVKH